MFLNPTHCLSAVEDWSTMETKALSLRKKAQVFFWEGPLVSVRLLETWNSSHRLPLSSRCEIMFCPWDCAVSSLEQLFVAHWGEEMSSAAQQGGPELSEPWADAGISTRESCGRAVVLVCHWFDPVTTLGQNLWQANLVSVIPEGYLRWAVHSPSQVRRHPDPARFSWVLVMIYIGM